MVPSASSSNSTSSRCRRPAKGAASCGSYGALALLPRLQWYRLHPAATAHLHGAVAQPRVQHLVDHTGHWHCFHACNGTVCIQQQQHIFTVPSPSQGCSILWIIRGTGTASTLAMVPSASSSNSTSSRCRRPAKGAA